MDIIIIMKLIDDYHVGAIIAQ